MTKKDRVYLLNEKSVTVIAKNWRDNEEIERALRDQLAAQGFDWDENVTDTGICWQFSNGQVVFRERRPKEHKATIKAMSSKFAYTSQQCGPVRCEYKDFQVNPDGSLESENTLIIPA